MEKYSVIGVMSGTSLDGLDMALCTFEKKDRWIWKIRQARTVPYEQDWIDRLEGLLTADAESFVQTHVDFGHFIGKRIKHFIDEGSESVDFIASHGHTIFHQPDINMTFQIGDGNAIAIETGIPVVYDFRSRDIALGGQGAPLVPIGDRMLFSDYDCCLNLGGIANVSFEKDGQRRAFDVCPANMLLNHLSGELGFSFDEDGHMARSGQLNTALLYALNKLPYYEIEGAKTLGREWFEKEIVPLFSDVDLDGHDKLRTAVEHIAYQIAESYSVKENRRMLVTGGGAFNAFLVEEIREKTQLEVIVPQEDLVNYKEAMVFAFLGVLRVRNEVNCLASVTGARQDSCCGILTS